MFAGQWTIANSEPMTIKASIPCQITFRPQNPKLLSNMHDQAISSTLLGNLLLSAEGTGRGPSSQNPLLPSARAAPLEELFPTSAIEARPNASLLVVCSGCSRTSWSFLLPKHPIMLTRFRVFWMLGSLGRTGSVSEIPFKFANWAIWRMEMAGVEEKRKSGWQEFQLYPFGSCRLLLTTRIDILTGYNLVIM